MSEDRRYWHLLSSSQRCWPTGPWRGLLPPHWRAIELQTSIVLRLTSPGLADVYHPRNAMMFSISSAFPFILSLAWAWNTHVKSENLFTFSPLLSCTALPKLSFSFPFLCCFIIMWAGFKRRIHLNRVETLGGIRLAQGGKTSDQPRSLLPHGFLLMLWVHMWPPRSTHLTCPVMSAGEYTTVQFQSRWCLVSSCC